MIRHLALAVALLLTLVLGTTGVMGLFVLANVGWVAWISLRSAS